MKKRNIFIGLSSLIFFSNLANADFITDMEPYKKMKVSDFVSLNKENSPDLDNYIIQKHGRGAYNYLYYSVATFLQNSHKCRNIDFNKIDNKKRKEVKKFCSITMGEFLKLIDKDVSEIRNRG